MEQIKAKILAHLIQNDGTVKDFSQAIYQVESHHRLMGIYPPTIVINKKSVILCQGL
jgi:cell fate (sporulation/competence/biofilm development) regulator YmcA (YheA/YmcA/DUF963 family)